MQRRTFLSAAAATVGIPGLAGCLGHGSSGPAGENPTEATPTPSPHGDPSPSPDGRAPTATPVPFPDDCGPLPDVEGLPARPSTWTESSARAYVTAFERAYVVGTHPRYGGIEDLQVTETERRGERVRVQLTVHGEPVTPTPGPDGRTATPLPAGASDHKALYRVAGDRLRRTLLGYAGEGAISSECWTLPAPDE